MLINSNFFEKSKYCAHFPTQSRVDSPLPASSYPLVRQRLFLLTWRMWLCAWCICNKNIDLLAAWQRAGPFP